jgi:uncharacterized membrane protein YGL010W
MKAQAEASVAAPLESHIERYAASHRKPVNRALHDFGIPLLMVSTLGLLAKLSRGQGPAPLRPNLAWPVLLGGSLWYLSQDRKVGLLTSAALVAAYAAGCALPTRTLCTLSAVGSLAHTVGHYGFEHRPPVFLSRPVALLEGPAWLVAVATGRFH